MGDPSSNISPPWSQHSPPLPPAATPLPFSAGDASSTPFTSSLSSFNLRARPSASQAPTASSTPSNADVAQAATSLEGYPLFANKRVSPTMHPSASPGTSPAPLSTLAHRKQSMLGAQPIFPRNTSPSPPLLEQPDDDDSALALAMREGSDSPMVLGSPTFEQSGFSFAPPAVPFGTRSRTHSESMGSTTSATPASPVALARALQGQRTPPPFLQRRLYNEMQEEDSNGSAPRSGSASSSGARADDESVDDISGLGLALGKSGNGAAVSGSASGSGEEGGRVGVVRRAVSRKPDLLPKSKSHLRVLSQLQSESGPADLAEVMSEAALHRLSVASSVPPVRSTQSSATASLACPLPPEGRLAKSAPLGNRFPEQANDDEMDRVASPASSGEDGDDVGEAGSDWGGMSVGGYGTEDEDERRSAIWTGIRGSGSATGMTIPPPNSQSTGRSPGSERGKMEIEAPNNSPSTPGWHSQNSRPGKRKITEDRFEPYAAAFKRRAVSPAALSPGGIASPLLSFTHSSTLPTPPPLPSFPTAGLTLPISIPSPSTSATTSHSHAAFFNTINHGPRSRAGSPVPSSLSSSAGRGGAPSAAAGQAFVGMIMSGRLEKESEEKNGRMGDAGDGLRNMSLG